MSKLRPIEWTIILAIFAIIWTLVAPTSSDSKHFFSPDTLQSKYKTETWFGACAWQSSDKPKDSELVEYLVKTGHWQPRPTEKPQWICTAHFNSSWRDGQSDLHKVLYWQADDWIAWSEERPQLATVVWPQVLTALRQGNKAGALEAVELSWAARHASTLSELEEQQNAIRQQ